jgi:hypothetical protein
VRFVGFEELDMLLSFRRYDGKMVDVDSGVIFRARPRIDSYDDPGVETVISYDLNPADPLYQRLPTKTPTTEVVALLATALPIAKLTTVTGAPVYVDASKVKAIEPPLSNPVTSPKGTKAVLFVYTQYQPVAETVAAARKIINAAIDAFSGSAPKPSPPG